MTDSLRDALTTLAAAAEKAGLDPQQARTEGAQLAAAVAEPARGAFADWAEQTGATMGDAHAFFEAASHARRWRGSPTTLLSQLANTNAEQARAYAEALAAVAAAACTLGEPNPQVAGTAGAVSAAQLAAASGGTPGPLGYDHPSDAPRGGLDPALLDRLKTSHHQRQAMDEFSKVGSGVFSQVLDQLAENQKRLEALRTGAGVDPSVLDVSGTDPRQGGAFGPLSGAPVTPAQPTDGAQEPAPVATQDAPGATPVEPEKPKEPEKSLDELLGELDALVGLDKVKAEIHRQTAVLRVEALREKAGLKSPTITRHLVFVGNPGTGKTTVARLVSGIYKALGLLSKGQLVEVDRSELVAGYLGQTAMKTADVAKSALGGLLFIVEAYSLGGDQFGQEAINTLVKEMEDNRDDLVVIVAGYPVPMAAFISENPGLASRFRTSIMFDDYTDDELRGIFTGMVDKADYSLGEGTLDAFNRLLAQQIRDETFGNGRFARNVLEAAIGKHAWRLRDVTEPTLDQLRTLLPEDLEADAQPEPVAWPEPEPTPPDTATPDTVTQDDPTGDPDDAPSSPTEPTTEPTTDAPSTGGQA